MLKAQKVETILLRNHVLSKNALSLERVMNYIARGGKIKVLREAIVVKV
jgi:hypothetical protein